MNVPDQFKQVGFLFAPDGFVAVLEKVATAGAAHIVSDSVRRQDPSHGRRQRNGPCSEQKVKVLCEAQDYVKLSVIIP